MCDPFPETTGLSEKVSVVDSEVATNVVLNSCHEKLLMRLPSSENVAITAQLSDTESVVSKVGLGEWKKIKL